MNFSIIIPNYNGCDFLLNCLESLYQSIKLCSDFNFEIILVDNNSTDPSPQIFQNFFKKEKLPYLISEIYNLRSNKGFAEAVNFGISKSKYDWIVVCNNDITIDKNWFSVISKIISDNKNPKISTFFSTVLNYNGTQIESQGFDFFYSGKAININNKKKFIPNTKYYISNTKIIWGAPASLVVYNKKIITKTGLFDEIFFTYEEDVDLSFRLNKLGYKTLYIPNIFSYHLGGGTSNKMGNFRNKQDFKNWHYLIIKNFTKEQIFKNLFAIIEERLRNLSCLIKSTPLHLVPKTIFFIYFEIFKNLPKILKKRHQIQKMLKYRNNL